MAEELRARPVAALCDIEKSYGGRRVLGPVRLEVRSGELLVLRGPNGAGKSTTGSTPPSGTGCPWCPRS